jgi:hypothetical protein
MRSDTGYGRYQASHRALTVAREGNGVLHERARLVCFSSEYECNSPPTRSRMPLLENR